MDSILGIDAFCCAGCKGQSLLELCSCFSRLKQLEYLFSVSEAHRPFAPLRGGESKPLWNNLNHVQGMMSLPDCFFFGGLTISSGTQQARDTTTGILFGLVQGPTKDSMSLLFEHRVVQLLIWKTGFAEVRLGIYRLGRRKEGPETFVEDHCPFSSRIPILKQCFIPLGQWLVGF